MAKGPDVDASDENAVAVDPASVLRLLVAYREGLEDYLEGHWDTLEDGLDYLNKELIALKANYLLTADVNSNLQEVVDPDGSPGHLFQVLTEHWHKAVSASEPALDKV
jgi:hypothetical protein